VVHFGASWAPSSIELNETLAELKKELKEDFNPAYVDAEGLSEVSLENNVEAAPTTIFFKVSLKPVLCKIEKLFRRAKRSIDWPDSPLTCEMPLFPKPSTKMVQQEVKCRLFRHQRR
jgi:thiol-disulfide isomerase/thioredoxin